MKFNNYWFTTELNYLVRLILGVNFNYHDLIIVSNNNCCLINV